MVSKKLIAKVIGVIGIILGLAAGCMVIQAELYMSPMNYKDSYAGLIFYFYSVCSIVSFPFLLIQYGLGKKRYLPLLFVFALYIIVTATIYFYDANLAGGISLFLVWFLFPLFIGNMILKNYAEKTK